MPSSHEMTQEFIEDCLLLLEIAWFSCDLNYFSKTHERFLVFLNNFKGDEECCDFLLNDIKFNQVILMQNKLVYEEFLELTGDDFNA